MCEDCGRPFLKHLNRVPYSEIAKKFPMTDEQRAQARRRAAERRDQF